MKQSEKIGELSKALVAAQKQFKTAEKDGSNPHFHSSYATIESVIDSVMPALNAQGIAVIQGPAADDSYQGACLETMLVHTSGEWISSLIKIPSGKNDAHGFGSAYTYARRYSLAAMCGIKQHDDDGNAAVEREKAAKNIDLIKKQPKDVQELFKLLKQKLGKGMSEDQYREAAAKIIQSNQGDPESIRAFLNEKSRASGAMVSQGEEGIP